MASARTARDPRRLSDRHWATPGDPLRFWDTDNRRSEAGSSPTQAPTARLSALTRRHDRRGHREQNESALLGRGHRKTAQEPHRTPPRRLSRSSSRRTGGSCVGGGSYGTTNLWEVAAPADSWPRSSHSERAGEREWYREIGGPRPRAVSIGAPPRRRALPRVARSAMSFRPRNLGPQLRRPVNGSSLP